MATNRPKHVAAEHRLKQPKAVVHTTRLILSKHIRFIIIDNKGLQSYARVRENVLHCRM